MDVRVSKPGAVAHWLPTATAIEAPLATATGPRSQRAVTFNTIVCSGFAAWGRRAEILEGRAPSVPELRWRSRKGVRAVQHKRSASACYVRFDTRGLGLRGGGQRIRGFALQTASLQAGSSHLGRQSRTSISTFLRLINEKMRLRCQSVPQVVLIATFVFLFCHCRTAILC
jgi:hypothetical protein